MTYSVVISYGSYAVDLTNNHVGVSHNFTNPFITFDTPQQAEDALGRNTKLINIGLVVNTIDLTFTLKDGPGTYNFNTPGTKYETLVYLAAYVKNAKILTLGSTTFYGHIENLSVAWMPGKKNLAENCTLTFHMSDNIAME